MPSLPDPVDALAPEVALAVAIEAARAGHDHARELFTRSLAALYETARRAREAMLHPDELLACATEIAT